MKRSKSNWEEIRSRVQASEKGLEEALGESPARIEAAYRKRAARLASRRPDQKFVPAGQSVAVITLGRERYAIDLGHLARILPFTECTPVPGAAPWIRGVINVDGEIRAVVDLGRLVVGVENSGVSGNVVILRQRGREVALQVDRVAELREILPSEVDSSLEKKYVKGVARGANVLDIDRVLQDIFSNEVVSTA